VSDRHAKISSVTSVDICESKVPLKSRLIKCTPASVRQARSAQHSQSACKRSAIYWSALYYYLRTSRVLHMLSATLHVKNNTGSNVKSYASSHTKSYTNSHVKSYANSYLKSYTNSQAKLINSHLKSCNNSQAKSCINSHVKSCAQFTCEELRTIRT